MIRSSDALRFVALFAGLVTLADWLGSDAELFPVPGRTGRSAMRCGGSARRLRLPREG